jgi:hypothetical protein
LTQPLDTPFRQRPQTRSAVLDDGALSLGEPSAWPKRPAWAKQIAAARQWPRSQ